MGFAAAAGVSFLVCHSPGRFEKIVASRDERRGYSWFPSGSCLGHEVALTMRAVALASACLLWSPCTRVCRLVRTCAFVSWLPCATLVSKCCKQCVSDRSINTASVNTASATFPATLDSLQFYMHDKLTRHAHPANCCDAPHEAVLTKHENLQPLCLQCHSSATTVLSADAAVVQPVLPWFSHTSTAALALSSQRHMVSRGLCDPAKQSGCPAKINLHPLLGSLSWPAGCSRKQDALCCSLN